MADTKPSSPYAQGTDVQTADARQRPLEQMRRVSEEQCQNIGDMTAHLNELADALFAAINRRQSIKTIRSLATDLDDPLPRGRRAPAIDNSPVS